MRFGFLELPPKHFTEDDFETGYIQHTVVQTLSKFRQVLVDELSILSYRVATDNDWVLFLEMLYSDFAKRTFLVLFAHAFGNSFQ